MLEGALGDTCRVAAVIMEHDQMEPITTNVPQVVAAELSNVSSPEKKTSSDVRSETKPAKTAEPKEIWYEGAD